MQRQLSTGDTRRAPGAGAGAGGSAASTGSGSASKRRARDLLRDYYSLDKQPFSSSGSQGSGNPLDMGTALRLLAIGLKKHRSDRRVFG